jgi:hypothetical protein
VMSCMSVLVHTAACHKNRSPVTQFNFGLRVITPDVVQCETDARIRFAAIGRPRAGLLSSNKCIRTVNPHVLHI